MTGFELDLLVVIALGFGFLFVRHRFRARDRRELARRRGLHYALRGLEELPAALQDTVLFTLADGGHERDVVSGDLELAEQQVPFAGFELTFQRDVRGEWAYLATEPPFRLHSPLTVLTYQLPAEFAHLLLKRRGQSERLAESPDEIYRSVASVAREASGIDRAVTVEPPPALGRAPVARPASRDYLIWAESREQAELLLPPSTIEHLESEAAGDRELVIELLGPLLVVYCASAGALSVDDTATLADFADELCRRLIIATAPLGPRGVGY